QAAATPLRDREGARAGTLEDVYDRGAAGPGVGGTGRGIFQEECRAERGARCADTAHGEPLIETPVILWGQPFLAAAAFSGGFCERRSHRKKSRLKKGGFSQEWLAPHSDEHEFVTQQYQGRLSACPTTLAPGTRR